MLNFTSAFQSPPRTRAPDSQHLNLNQQPTTMLTSAQPQPQGQYQQPATPAPDGVPQGSGTSPMLLHHQQEQQHLQALHQQHHLMLQQQQLGQQQLQPTMAPTPFSHQHTQQTTPPTQHQTQPILQLPPQPSQLHPAQTQQPMAQQAPQQPQHLMAPPASQHPQDPQNHLLTANVLKWQTAYQELTQSFNQARSEITARDSEIATLNTTINSLRSELTKLTHDTHDAKRTRHDQPNPSIWKENNTELCKFIVETGINSAVEHLYACNKSGHYPGSAITDLATFICNFTPPNSHNAQRPPYHTFTGTHLQQLLSLLAKFEVFRPAYTKAATPTNKLIERYPNSDPEFHAELLVACCMRDIFSHTRYYIDANFGQPSDNPHGGGGPPGSNQPKPVNNCMVAFIRKGSSQENSWGRATKMMSLEPKTMTYNDPNWLLGGSSIKNLTFQIEAFTRTFNYFARNKDSEVPVQKTHSGFDLPNTFTFKPLGAVVDNRIMNHPDVVWIKHACLYLGAFAPNRMNEIIFSEHKIDTPDFFAPNFPGTPGSRKLEDDPFADTRDFNKTHMDFHEASSPLPAPPSPLPEVDPTDPDGRDPGGWIFDPTVNYTDTDWNGTFPIKRTKSKTTTTVMKPSNLAYFLHPMNREVLLIVLAAAQRASLIFDVSEIFGALPDTADEAIFTLADIPEREKVFTTNFIKNLRTVSTIVADESGTDFFSLLWRDRNLPEPDTSEAKHALFTSTFDSHGTIFNSGYLPESYHDPDCARCLMAILLNKHIPITLCEDFLGTPST
jgi:hypothetical protein